MNTTMAVMRMVPAMVCVNSDQLRRRCMAASSMAPTAPMAPASVGVQMAVLMPGRPPMLPSTAKIKAPAGKMPRRHFFHSAQPMRVRAVLGTPGRSWGRTRDNTKV